MLLLVIIFSIYIITSLAIYGLIILAFPQVSNNKKTNYVSPGDLTGQITMDTPKELRRERKIIQFGSQLASSFLGFIADISDLVNAVENQNIWRFLSDNWLSILSMAIMIGIVGALLGFFIVNMYKRDIRKTVVVTAVVVIGVVFSYRTVSFSAPRTEIDGNIARRSFNWKEDVAGSQFTCTDLPLTPDGEIEDGRTFSILDQQANLRQEVVTAIAQSNDEDWLFIKADDILGLFSAEPNGSSITKDDICYFWLQSKMFVPIDDSDKVDNLVKRSCDECK